MNTPEWATELIQEVCRDHRRKLPTVYWKQARSNVKWGEDKDENGRHIRTLTFRTGSSGSTRTWQGIIKINAGSDVADQKLVLLHELAHHLTAKSKKGKREHHSLRFWRIAVELYAKHGIDMQVAYNREKNYKEKAKWAFREWAIKEVDKTIDFPVLT